jgi:CRISPR-associated exonuclease Cas4
MTVDLIAVTFAVAGAVAVLAGTGSLRRRRNDRRLGGLAAIDAGGEARTLRAERYRLVGRPDVLRRRPDGRLVPVELKSRPAPTGGPYPSHRLQLAAYCLLVEEETGRSPPFGVLRYADREFAIRWDRSARAELLAALDALRRPYDGRASPTPSKCAGCAWSPRCDASLARG